MHSISSVYMYCFMQLFVFSSHRLAWERGLVVALLAGTIQAMYTTSSTANTTSGSISEADGGSGGSGGSQELVLRLLCQLHTCRYVI